MKDRVHYFSTYDMSISFYLPMAEEVMKKYQSGWRPTDVNDVIELYNIWLFVDNDVYMKSWTEETLQIIRKDIKTDVIRYFNGLEKTSWVDIYKQIEIGYRKYFWEIIDKFNIDGFITLDNLREAFSENDSELINLLHQSRLVYKHQQTVATLLKENSHTAEWLLQEFVEEDKLHSHEHLYFPKALTLKDREGIISEYLDSANPNLNYVRLVLLAKKDDNLRLSDTLLLKATKLEKKLNEEVLTSGSTVHFKYQVSISDEKDKSFKWVDRDEEDNPILCYSRPKMLACSDEDLLHYIRYVFDFLTPNGLIPFVAKMSEVDVMERLMGLSGKYAYPVNMAFRYYEAISMLQIEAMQNVLSQDGRSIEQALKVFYEHYLKDKYGFPSGTLSLADNAADWITKCRTIAPEIDRVSQRYEQFADTGTVDEELLRISSDSIRVTNVKSSNTIRYYSIKGQPSVLYRLFHLFFSDQSMLTFVDPFKDSRYYSFYHLLTEQDEKISYDNYQDYQKRDIDFLIEEGYLSKNEDGCLCVEKKREIGVLKLLYEYHCCPIQAHGTFEQEILKEMERKGWLEEDNHLLSEEERNYFDYYLYNSKYTNSRALRNRYLHGSHVDADKVEVHRNAYNRLLILLILELLKIEDDLISKDLQKIEPKKDNMEEITSVMLGQVAEVLTYSEKASFNGKQVFLPKKLGTGDGYIFVNTLTPTVKPAYLLRPKSGVIPEYIAFLLNSSLFRMSYTHKTSGKPTLNIERIKGFNLPYCDLNGQAVCGKLEHLIAQYQINSSVLKKEETLQLNLFLNVRDYICFELYQPNFKKDTGIEFLNPFKELMQDITGEEKEQANQIAEILLKPGNVLMDNMKKARILLSDKKED